MKRLSKTLLLTTLLFSTQTHATVYENAEDESTNRWHVYDNTPEGASLDNVYIEDRDNNAIEFIGEGTSNGYILGNWEGRGSAWNNTTEHTLKWEMNFEDWYVIYVRVMTKNGPRYIYYTPSNKSLGKRNGEYIHVGLGKKTNNGTWQKFTRDLEADLKKYEPNNRLIAVNAFLVRGNGLIDNIELIKSNRDTVLKITELQHKMIDQIVSIFENGTPQIEYAYAEHIDDQHGITAGRSGFTSATGDMLMVIEKYTQNVPNNILKKYIPELKRLEKIYINNSYELSDEGANIDHLDGLMVAWKDASKDKRFIDVQDKINNELYANPVLKKAKELGISYPLTFLSLYDASIQHGYDGMMDIVEKITIANPKAGGDENSWLKAFNAIRLEVMLTATDIDGTKIWEDTTYRQKELEDMRKAKNYSLEPFKMIIEDWGDESFSLPQEEVLTRWYQPKLNSSWHIQLSGKIDTNHHVDIYDIDLFDSSKKLIDALHKKGKKVICYFSAGSYENWREDKDDFPENTLGKKLNGWAGERWLDIRNVNLRKIMSNRIALAKEKGCDGIDPDNVDGYTNNTGFQLTSENQLDYNIFLANEAHKIGLSVGLKNDIDQINSLVNYFDFAVNEECHVYNECPTLLPFLDHSKPVLNIEYAESLSDAKDKSDDICRNNSIQKMKTLILNLELNNKFSVRCNQ